MRRHNSMNGEHWNHQHDSTISMLYVDYSKSCSLSHVDSCRRDLVRSLGSSQNSMSAEPICLYASTWL